MNPAKIVNQCGIPYWSDSTLEEGIDKVYGFFCFEANWRVS